MKVGDVVYFQKESNLASKWTMGEVNMITKSKDGVVRSVEVRYTNLHEKEPRFTTRSVRSLVKLFHVEDTGFMEEMAEVQKFMVDLEKEKLAVPPLRLARTGKKFKVVNETEVLYTLNADEYEMPSAHHFEEEDGMNVLDMEDGLGMLDNVSILASRVDTDFDL